MSRKAMHQCPKCGLAMTQDKRGRWGCEYCIRELQEIAMNVAPELFESLMFPASFLADSYKSDPLTTGVLEKSRRLVKLMAHKNELYAMWADLVNERGGLDRAVVMLTATLRDLQHTIDALTGDER